MVFLKKNYIDPTGRQNFGDAPGQIPKLILTLCLKGVSKKEGQFIANFLCASMCLDLS